MDHLAARERLAAWGFSPVELLPERGNFRRRLEDRYVTVYFHSGMSNLERYLRARGVYHS